MSNGALDRVAKTRRWIANKLAIWARRIYPQSEEVLRFYADRMIDLAITGQSTVRVTRVHPEETLWPRP